MDTLNESNDQYRILTPSEFEALREAIPKTRLRMIVDVLMFTGMRYSELVHFSHSKVWFDPTNRAITLPRSATKTAKARVIHLTPTFSRDLRAHLQEYKKLQVPTLRSMEENLNRWWNDQDLPAFDWKPTPKTFRKSWESWLLFSGYDSLKVALSQGHTQTIQLNHYANMSARLKSEKEAVLRMTEGWMT